MIRNEENDKERIRAAQDFLAEYRMCEDMLCLRKYERKRKESRQDYSPDDSFLAAGENYWKMRMEEIRFLLSAMPNGREKILLYYRFIRGESVEHSADMLQVSRRTAYRMLNRGLLRFSFFWERQKIKVEERP